MKLNENELRSIVGGENIVTSALINSLSKAIDSVVQLGRSFGTSIRRMTSHNICPIQK